MKSHERSEIVDFVCGTDLDKDWLFPQKATMSRDFKSHKKIDMSVSVPEEGSGGWRGHARHALISLLDELEGMEVADIRARYPSLAPFHDKILTGIQLDLYGNRGGEKRGRDLILERNSPGIHLGQEQGGVPEMDPRRRSRCARPPRWMNR